jgi:hypothetical protein
MSKLGSNSVRMPINEATVSSYWTTYTGAIDKAISKGKVLLCYWSAASGAKPADTNAFWNMWTTVVNKYGSDSNCYFEIFNEPNMYSATDLCNLYYRWITKYTTASQSRVILDGTGMAQNVPGVGSDSRLSGCLLAVHDYTMFVSNPYTTESQWESHIQSYVGSYENRTVCTEWGAPMSPGTKSGVNYGSQNYDSVPGSYFVAYVRGISSQLRNWNMGSFFWPGLRDGDWYSMTTKSGSGSDITLSVPNQSGLDRLQYAWGPAPVSVLPLGKAPMQSSNFKVTCNESTLKLKFKAPQSGLTSMKLFNSNGKVIKIMSLPTMAGEVYSRSFDCNDIPNGLYIVKLENGARAIGGSKILLSR